jgi:hypothetical protein
MQKRRGKKSFSQEIFLKAGAEDKGRKGEGG